MHNNKYNINDIKALLEQINDAVQSEHGDTDDELGAIVWNCCLQIAEQLGTTMY